MVNPLRKKCVKVPEKAVKKMTVCMKNFLQAPQKMRVVHTGKLVGGHSCVNAKHVW